MPRGQETLFCTTPIPLLPLSIPWFPTEREKLVLHCRGIFLGGSPRGGPDLPTTSVGCTLDTSTQPAVTQVAMHISGVCPKGWQFWSDLLRGCGWKRIQGSGKPVPLFAMQCCAEGLSVSWARRFPERLPENSLSNCRAKISLSDLCTHFSHVGFGPQEGLHWH